MCFKKGTTYNMIVETVKCSEVEWNVEPEDLGSDLGQVSVTQASGASCKVSRRLWKLRL